MKFLRPSNFNGIDFSLAKYLTKSLLSILKQIYLNNIFIFIINNNISIYYNFKI